MTRQRICDVIVRLGMNTLEVDLKRKNKSGRTIRRGHFGNTARLSVEKSDM